MSIVAFKEKLVVVDNDRCPRGLAADVSRTRVVACPQVWWHSSVSGDVQGTRAVLSAPFLLAPGDGVYTAFFNNAVAS